MDAFPAYVPLAGRTVIIAGTGEASDAKARLFESSVALVVRLTEDQALATDAYAGAALVFIAGGDPFATLAAAAARGAGARINVVDRPELSDFYTPAIVDRGAVVGAIGTGGAAPVLAAQLRTALEAEWPERLGALAELLRHLQGAARERLPLARERRSFLRSLLQGDAAEAALRGELETAVALAQARLWRAAPEPGVIRLLQRPSSTDLLTLRALRALGQADRLVFDPSRDQAVAGLARRDALRVPAREADAGAISGWMRTSEQIVWIAAVDEFDALVDGLGAFQVERLTSL